MQRLLSGFVALIAGAVFAGPSGSVAAFSKVLRRLLPPLLTRTARDLGSTGRDSEYGFGLIQPRAALFGLGILR